MADRTQISQASGALEYSSLQWPKLATENCRKYTLIADVKSKFSGGTAVGFKNKKNVRGKCFTWLLHRKNLPLVKPNTDKWGERNRSSSRGGLYSNKQTKTQTWNFPHLLHLMHSTSFPTLFSRHQADYRLWDWSIWLAVSLDGVTVPCYYGAQGRLFFPMYMVHANLNCVRVCVYACACVFWALAFGKLLMRARPGLITWVQAQGGERRGGGTN